LLPGQFDICVACEDFHALFPAEDAVLATLFSVVFLEDFLIGSHQVGGRPLLQVLHSPPIPLHLWQPFILYQYMLIHK